MLTARVVMEAARDRHPAFDRQRNPDALLLRHLSREQRRLVGKVMQANPNALASTATITLASYVFATGYALPAHLWLNPKGEVVFSDTDFRPAPLYLGSWDDRDQPRRGYFAGERAGVLFLFGTADDWANVATASVSYTPLPAELTALTATLTVPDSGEACLAALLAAFMGGRGHTDDGLPPIDLVSLKVEAEAAEADFLRAIRATYRATSFRIQAVR